MTKKKVYPVHFTGQRGQQEASEAFQQNETYTWQRWLKHSRDNKKSTVVTARSEALAASSATGAGE
jgi:hypothetical protein